MKPLYLFVIFLCLSMASYAQIGAISGPNAVCNGASTTFSDTTSGGTWSSGTPSVGTIIASTGAFTGLTAGVASITYTVGGSSVTMPVTVNPLPTEFTVTGGGLSCSGAGVPVGTAGSQTGVNYQLFLGGTAIGTATAGTGLSLSFGLQTVAGTYTVAATNSTTGCYRTFSGSVTVTTGTAPATITGPSAICSGYPITLSDSTSGGTFTSSSPAIATVGSVSGVVTGIIAGVAIITYTLSSGCFATHPVTINPSPSYMSGTYSECIGSSYSFTDYTPGGIWSVSNSNATLSGSTGTSTTVTAVASPGATITYTLGSGCYTAFPITINPTPPAITGPSTVCTGSYSTLADATPGGTWSSANAVLATVFAGTGVVTGVSAGTTIITYTLATGCFNTRTVTVNPTPPAITGTTVVCSGATGTLSNSASGGTWSSSNPGSAAVVAGTGVVTGISAALATISYTLSTGCFVTYVITVNTSPAAITGASATCPGGTLLLSEATGGGTWSSTSTGIATVGFGTGIVSGVSPGVAIINYTMPAGCSASKTITITTTPAPITGSSGICLGGTVTLTDASGIGTWTTSNNSIASLGSTGTSTGNSLIVNGSTSGTATISYSIGTGCTPATMPVTVAAAVTAITGPATVCPGQTITLSNTTTGGTWSSSLPGIATVNTSGGVTGIATGTTTITYTLPTGCFTTTTITVIAGLGTISGPSSVCAGSAITLTDPSTGGTWSSSDNTVGTVSSGGIVTGTGAGTATISYSAGSGCTTSTYLITVNPSPALITGPSTVCPGQAITLSDATAGGTWSSSAPPVAAIGPGSGIVTGGIAGTAAIIYTLPDGCTATANINTLAGPATITGPNLICMASTITLSDAAAGGTWSSSNGAIASVGTSGVVTGNSVGIATISYTLGLSCPAAIYSVTVAPAVASITGPPSVCTSQTITLSSGGTGTWSSSAAAIATVGTLTGVVTGVTAGAAIITYTGTGGCFTTTTVAVLPGPAAITGPHSVCVDATIALNDATTGGVWSTSDSVLTTISTSGIVFGAATGIATISYTFGTGCPAATFSVTVFAPPTPISGPSALCMYQTIILTSGGGSGTWSSSLPGTAYVNPLTGDVYGYSAGTATISFTLASGCRAAKDITVNVTPAVISGYTALCVGIPYSFTDATSGGVWSVANPSIASVTTSGVVTGTTLGTTTVSYTMPGGCATGWTISVTNAPAPISGPATVCNEQFITLSDATAGGTWHSSNTSVATITSTGLVTAISAGTTNISYTAMGGCPAVTTVTVTATSGVITASAPSVCVSNTLALTDTTTGGTWSSASPSIATVNTSGIVTGIAVGTTNITYQVGTGCPAIKTVTVTPGPLTGTPVVPDAGAYPNTVCSGAGVTLQLNNIISACDITYQWQQSADGITFTNVPGATNWYYYYNATSTQYWRCKATATNTGLYGYSRIVLLSVMPSILSHSVVDPPTSVCGSPNFSILICSSSPSLSVKTWFGDGTTATSTTFIPAYSTSTGAVAAYFYHTYSSAGTYTVKQVLYNSGVAIDSITFSYTYHLCYILPVTYFYDANTNCGFDAGEYLNRVPVLTEIDSNGVNIGTISCTSGFYYRASGPVGTIYTFKFLSSTGGGLAASCSPGAVYDTIQPSVVTYPARYIGLICTSGSAYDLAESILPQYTTGTSQVGYIIVKNNLCPPEDGNVTLNFSPQYNFAYSFPAPASVTGHIATWHFTDVASNAPQTQIFYVLNTPAGVVLPPGDTVHSSFLTTGTLPGDIDLTNNFISRIDTVMGAFDPNEMLVSPSGNILPCSQLKYTIGFENTGNDTAFNISVFDTLSQYLDPQSLQIETATAVMNISTTPYGNKTVVKFDFPSINLPDSSHHGEATGMVVFNIKTKPGLADGTTIDNYAGIVFDVNTAVLTNVVENKIGMSPIAGSTSACPGATGNVAENMDGGVWSISNANATLAAGVVSALNTGLDTISYTVTNSCGSRAVSSVFTVNALPYAAAVSGSDNVCVSAAIALADSVTGGTWSTSDGSVAGVSAGSVSGVSEGTATISYTVTNGCGAATATKTITVNPLPYVAPVTGSASVCTTASTTLSDATPGGTWSSSNTGIATVSGGILNGISAGWATITYSYTNSCGTATSIKTMIVNPQPYTAPVSGGSNVCSGSNLSLSDITTGGTWNSSNMAVATIASGVVSGISAGTVTISYATTNMCGTATATKTITVNPLPAAISGSSSVCAEATTTLADADPGGIFTSGNAAVAIVGTTSGIITGVATGSTVMTYTLPTGCSVNRTVSVNPLPESYGISGGGAYCAGGAGIHIGMDASAIGFDYILMMGTTLVGTIAGNGAALDFGLQTTAGLYTVLSMNTTTSCEKIMPGIAAISIRQLDTPVVSASAAPGTNVCSGTPVTFNASGANGGTSPLFEWLVNGISYGTGETYTYIPVAGDVVKIMFTSNAPCATPATVSSSLSMTVEGVPEPVVTITQTGSPVAHGQPLTLKAKVTNYAGSLTYQWLVNNAYIAGATDSTYTSSTLANQDSAGCVVTSANTCGTGIGKAAIAVNINTTGIAPLAETALLTILPNPNQGTFTLTGYLPHSQNEELNLTVTDMLGQVVYAGKCLSVNGNVNEKIVLRNTLSSGIYLLHMTTTSCEQVYHFVISR